jgi:hypothetical protein
MLEDSAQHSARMTQHSSSSKSMSIICEVASGKLRLVFASCTKVLPTAGLKELLLAGRQRPSQISSCLVALSVNMWSTTVRSGVERCIPVMQTRNFISMISICNLGYFFRQSTIAYTQSYRQNMSCRWIHMEPQTRS